MKRNFKRTISLILAVLMVMTAVPLSGLATEGEHEHKYLYSSSPFEKKHYRTCETCLVPELEDCSESENVSCGEAPKCTKCDAVLGAVVEHTFTEDTIAEKFYVDGTGDCRNKKMYYYNCINDGCDEIGTETFEGEEYGDCIPGTGVSNEDAECGVDGTLTIKCTVCGDVLDEDAPDAGSALEHVFDKKVEKDDRKVEGSEATCTTGAKYYYTCSRPGCDEWSDTLTFVGEADEDAHDFSNEMKDPDFLKSEATCSKPAVYYNWCSICGKTSKALFGEDTDLTFSYGEPHARPTKFAEVCEVFYEKDADGEYVTDEKGNLIVARDREVISEATCMKAEGCSYLCARCGEPLVSAEEYDLNGTYSAEYELYFNYDHPALNPNHQLEETTVDGKKVKLMELIESEEYWDATCTKEGKTKTYKCLFHEGPNNIVGGETIPVKGHTFKEEVSKSYRAADCRQPGHQASKSCTTCKTTYYWDKDGKMLKDTNSFNPDKAPVDITFDKVDHKDTNGDGLCDLEYINSKGTKDICGLDVNAEVVTCSCICHKDGIMYIIALILKWFWRLTGSNQYCEAPCGDAHY